MAQEIGASANRKLADRSPPLIILLKAHDVLEVTFCYERCAMRRAVVRDRNVTRQRSRLSSPGEQGRHGARALQARHSCDHLVGTGAQAAPLQYLTGAGDKAAPVVFLTWGLLAISIAVILIIGLLLAGAIWRRPGETWVPGARMALKSHEGGLNWLWLGGWCLRPSCFCSPSSDGGGKCWRTSRRPTQRSPL